MNKKAKATLEKLSFELSFKKYSENTIKIYIHYVNEFLLNFDKDVYHISQLEAINWLKNYNYTSKSKQNQIISSVKALYKYVVKCDLKKFDIERPRKSKTLPKVIDKDYLLKCISQIKNIKHQAIISLGYSVGLRVSEVINLKIDDIDSKRMIIHIRNAKGSKDRIVPMSQNILILLRKYYKEYKPYKYLFNGQNNLKYTSGSCNKIVKRYLGNNYHFHMLRHSSFTSMLENGTDISIIQKIAGHKKTDTTRIYAQVSNQMLKTANTPI
jgi:site-specific recombinase XerD